MDNKFLMIDENLNRYLIEDQKVTDFLDSIPKDEKGHWNIELWYNYERQMIASGEAKPITEQEYREWLKQRHRDK